MVDTFVNPYTFVPLSKQVLRRCPSGHDGTAPSFSGRISLTWKLVSPLLLPAWPGDLSANRSPWLERENRKAKVRIPGSSIKGAVRSLHEAMFNGCFRVVDEDFVPAYREPASTPPDLASWRLAIVTESASGQPTGFQIAGPEVTWVDAVSLKARWRGGVPRSGDLADIAGDSNQVTYPQGQTRDEMHHVCAVSVRASRGDTPVGEPFPLARIFLVTDTGVRSARGQAMWASALLTDEVVQFEATKRDSAAWTDFLRLTSQTRDRRELNRSADSAWRTDTSFARVDFPKGTRVAERAKQSGYLFRGDVVWVKLENGRIAGLRMAQIWRKLGKGAVRGRLGEAAPCPRPEHPEWLCLSCATFGSATTDPGRPQGEKTSYAGHVRFSAAIAEGVTTRIVKLAPSGLPSPGVGNFYLAPRTRPDGLNQDEIPSQWGVGEASTSIRGRKFYWHSDPDAQAKHWCDEGVSTAIPNYEWAPGQSKKMLRQAILVEAGATFKATITVDGLGQVAVDALLAALDPGRVLGLTPYGAAADRTYATHFGGGKPHGLGSIVLTEMACELRPTVQRYADPYSAPSSDFDGLPRTRASQVAQRCGGGRQWESLARILDIDGLGKDARNLVSYPPGAGWGQFGTREFRESFKFFEKTNGQQLERGPRDWVVLPLPTEGPEMAIPDYSKGKKK